MSHTISNFIDSFAGGTRLNRFKVSGDIGSTNRVQGTFTNFHIRSASLPSSTISPIPISYRGRVVNYPGERTYDPWVITVLDDNPKTSQNKTLYTAFHNWMEEINSHDTNISSANINNNPRTSFAKSTWSVEQLDPNGTITLRKMTLYHCWPVLVGPLQLDMGQDNVLNAFSVTIAYTYYTLNASK